MDDELNLDRAIDVPVYRDVLAWDVYELGALNWSLLTFSCPTSQIPLVSALLKQMWIACRWLNLFATNHLRIRRDCAIVFGLWLVAGSSLQGPPSLLLERVSRLHFSTDQANLLSNRRTNIWLSTHNERGLHWWPNIYTGGTI